jgi:hypothetical protein
MARILTEEYRAGAYTCVMHCFSSGAGLARAALDLGFYLSMSGIAAFPKSHDLRAIFAAAPVDRILVETDSPYLAPPPYRGKRNEPAYTAHTARVGAEVFGVTRRSSPPPPPPISTGCSPQRRRPAWAKATPEHGGAALHHPRLRLLGGVPRLGGHWGDCDPDEPRNTRRRCSMLVQRFDEGGDHPRADRHLARPAPAAARRGHRAARRGDLHPFPCRSCPRARRPADDRLQHAKRLPSGPTDPRRTTCCTASATPSSSPRAAPIPPSSTCMPSTAT